MQLIIDGAKMVHIQVNTLICTESSIKEELANWEKL